jgi:hypothetical protein
VSATPLEERRHEEGHPWRNDGMRSVHHVLALVRIYLLFFVPAVSRPTEQSFGAKGGDAPKFCPDPIVFCTNVSWQPDSQANFRRIEVAGVKKAVVRHQSCSCNASTDAYYWAGPGVTPSTNDVWFVFGPFTSVALGRSDGRSLLGDLSGRRRSRVGLARALCIRRWVDCAVLEF